MPFQVTLKANQSSTVTMIPEDSSGNPAPSSSPEWSALPGNIGLTMTIAPDGMSALFSANASPVVGTYGIQTVVANTANLNIQNSFSVVVVPDIATQIVYTATTPA